MTDKPHFRRTSDGQTLIRTSDGFRNVVANLGTDRDKSFASEYTGFELSNEQARNAYRGSWIPRKLVNIPAEDATRRWRAWGGVDKQTEALAAEEKRLDLRIKVKEALQSARLYGGSAILIGTKETENLEEPLDPQDLKSGGLEFLTVLDRRDLVPGPVTYRPSSPYFGLPEIYSFSTSGGA